MFSPFPNPLVWYGCGYYPRVMFLVYTLAKIDRKLFYKIGDEPKQKKMFRKMRDRTKTELPK